MPIRMEDDPQDQQDFNESSSSRSNFGGGGGGSLLSFLPLLLGLFSGGGGGKKILLLLLIAGGAYFLFAKKGCSGTTDAVQNLFSKSGYSFSPEQFKKASVYEGLEADNEKNPLPEAVSLLRFAPDRKNQGEQGSCVAWSSVYAARSIIEAASTGEDPNSTAFSPAFVYNQIGLEGCEGSYIQRAMEFMTKKGVVPYDEFPYTDQDCSRQPTSSQWNDAAQNKMHGFTRLTESDDVNGISIRAIKEHLAKDAPVVIGMMVGGSFMQEMYGKEVWTPTSEDHSQMGFGGHAMCVIGYDDRKQAFQLMNSWGTDWGTNGVAWVRYADFKEFVREAYGIDPMPKRGAALNTGFECAIGLVQNDNKQYIPLKLKSGNVFETESNMSAGTKFKWRSRTVRNVISISSEKKLTVPATRCFLIRIKTIRPRPVSHPIAASPDTGFSRAEKVWCPTISDIKIFLPSWCLNKRSTGMPPIQAYRSAPHQILAPVCWKPLMARLYEMLNSVWALAEPLILKPPIVNKMQYTALLK